MSKHCSGYKPYHIDWGQEGKVEWVRKENFDHLVAAVREALMKPDDPYAPLEAALKELGL